MDERIDAEFELIRKYYPTLVISNCKRWGLIEKFVLPPGIHWNKEHIPICFNIPNGYPGSAPYGIYVPTDLQCDDKEPLSFRKVADNKPPFEGIWGMFSWSPDAGEWKPVADILKGSNLLNFIKTFDDRFKEGV
jgi:hypothetical protein